MLEFLNKENLHHAYLLLGSRAEVKSALVAFLEEMLGGELAGNPDVEFVVHDSMGVDEARAVSARASQTPLGARRFFVLEIGAATDQAQNALLKTLEDPRAGIHFFVLAEHEGIFLETLVSRFYILRHTASSSDDMKALAQKFLAGSVKDRTALIKPFTEKLDDPDEKRKQKRDTAQFLYAMSRLLEEKIPKSARAEKALREIVVFEKYFTDSAFNPRLVLEHLALVI